MDKVLIKQHLNTIDFVMNNLQRNIDFQDLKLSAGIIQDVDERTAIEMWIDSSKEALCDLDTIRQEYQKELNKCNITMN